MNGEELYEKYNKLIWSVIHQFRFNKQDKEDIFQDVFVKILDKKDRILKVEDKINYIYSITRNSCLDFAKELKNNKEITFSDHNSLKFNQTQFEDQNCDFFDWIVVDDLAEMENMFSREELIAIYYVIKNKNINNEVFKNIKFDFLKTDVGIIDKNILLKYCKEIIKKFVSDKVLG